MEEKVTDFTKEEVENYLNFPLKLCQDSNGRISITNSMAQDLLFFTDKFLFLELESMSRVINIINGEDEKLRIKKRFALDNIFSVSMTQNGILIQHSAKFLSCITDANVMNICNVNAASVFFLREQFLHLITKRLNDALLKP